MSNSSLTLSWHQMALCIYYTMTEHDLPDIRKVKQPYYDRADKIISLKKSEICKLDSHYTIIKTFESYFFIMLSNDLSWVLKYNDLISPYTGFTISIDSLLNYYMSKEAYWLFKWAIYTDDEGCQYSLNKTFEVEIVDDLRFTICLLKYQPSPHIIHPFLIKPRNQKYL